MLSRANIAVAVHGNSSCDTAEGANNALRQADFALGQFKHLKPLLLVHGRENYRRNAHTTFYMIYKALMITMPTFFFAMYNQFSGANLFDSLSTSFVSAQVVYTAAITLLPPIVYGILDLEYDKEALLKNP